MNSPDGWGDVEPEFQAPAEITEEIEKEMEERRDAEIQRIFDAEIPVDAADLTFVERAMKDLALDPDKTAPFIRIPRDRLFEFIFKSARLNKAPIIVMVMQLGDAASYLGVDIFDLPPETVGTEGADDSESNEDYDRPADDATA